MHGLNYYDCKNLARMEEVNDTAGAPMCVHGGWLSYEARELRALERRGLCSEVRKHAKDGNTYWQITDAGRAVIPASFRPAA